MRAPRENTLFFLMVFGAILLQLIPWPLAFSAFKPWLLGLVVAYYALESPGQMSLGFAFLIGLFADTVSGVQLFGEQALRLTILVYILLRFRYRIRFFPLWQQTLAIGALLLNDCVLTLWVHWLAHGETPRWSFWLSPLTAALLWPLIFFAFDRLRFIVRVRRQ